MRRIAYILLHLLIVPWLLSSCEADRIEEEPSLIGVWSGELEKKESIEEFEIEVTEDHIVLRGKAYSYEDQDGVLKLKYIYSEGISAGEELEWEDVASRCWVYCFTYRLEKVNELHLTANFPEGWRNQINFVQRALQKGEFLKGKSRRSYQAYLERLRRQDPSMAKGILKRRTNTQ